MKHAFLLLACRLLCCAVIARATDHYEYGANECVTIRKGTAPDGKYAITAHGEGELRIDHFHIYLANAVNGKKIGPLEEITEALDTGAGSFAAEWSQNSEQVVIIYLIGRHEPLKAVSYRVGKGRALLLKGPTDVTREQNLYFQKGGDRKQRGRPGEDLRHAENERKLVPLFLRFVRCAVSVFAEAFCCRSKTPFRRRWEEKNVYIGHRIGMDGTIQCSEITMEKVRVKALCTEPGGAFVPRVPASVRFGRGVAGTLTHRAHALQSGLLIRKVPAASPSLNIST